MIKDSVLVKLFFIGAVAGGCLIASMLVLGLVYEREGRLTEVTEEVGADWGRPQTLLGPVLVFTDTVQESDGTSRTRSTYVLPDDLNISSTLVPEVRSRGIFEATVHTQDLAVMGAFSADDIPVQYHGREATLVVALSDTRSIEKQVTLTWQGTELPFEPGTRTQLFGETGVHTPVTLARGTDTYEFAFAVTLRGSSNTGIVPLARETTATMTSTWQSPTFTGAFLPGERTIDADGFSATWNVSSFGRGYPQNWQDDEVSYETLMSSQFGVGLYEGVDLYTQVERSVKYSVLFIVVTFTVFFLFEVLTAVRIHPIQYLLVGAALALFYLLLLSLAEQVGFMAAYLTATGMTALLVTLYSISILGDKLHAALVLVTLVVLYGYLYFVLKLEDYALLFGSLLVFALLGVVMYTTRKIDWFSVQNT